MRILRNSYITKLFLRFMPNVVTVDQRAFIWFLSKIVKPKEVVLICFSVNTDYKVKIEAKFDVLTNITEIENLNPDKDFCDSFTNAVSRMASSSKFSDAVAINRNIERNPLTSNLLRNSYLIIQCMRLIKTNADVIFITDRKEFKYLIRRSLSVRKFHTIFLHLGIHLKVICTLPRFFIWYFLNKCRTMKLRTERPPDLLINTFVQTKTKISKFSDSYFPGMSDHLDELNLTYRYLISGYIWFPTRIASEEGSKIFPEFNYFKLRDFYKSFRTTMRRGYAFKKDFSINGFKLDYLWGFETRCNSSALDLFHIGMRLSLFERLSRVMPTVKAVVCEFEGMLIERALSLSRNNSQNSFKVFALQHNNYSADLLNTFPTEDDFSRNLLPDKIFFMGSKYLEEFKSRYPKFSRLGLVPAYRYRGAFEITERESKENWVGVVCGIRLVENLEVISWLKKLNHAHHINFSFFIHPSMQSVDRKILSNEIADCSFSVNHLSFVDALSHSNRFIISSSSSGVIALFHGKQIMRVPTWKCADINPLSDFQQFYYHSESEEQVIKFLSSGSHMTQLPKMQISNQHLNSYFNFTVDDLKLEIQKIRLSTIRRQ